jgi:hypothetical protein
MHGKILFFATLSVRIPTEWCRIGARHLDRAAGDKRLEGDRATPVVGWRVTNGQQSCSSLMAESWWRLRWRELYITYIQNPATVMCLFPTFLYLPYALRAFHIPLTRAATRLILHLLKVLKQIGCHSNPQQFLLDARPCRSDILVDVKQVYSLIFVFDVYWLAFLLMKVTNNMETA